MIRLRGCKERKHKTTVRYCKTCDVMVKFYYDRIALIKDIEGLNFDGVMDDTLRDLRGIDKYEIYK